MAEKKVTSGIKGFDEMLGGGFLPGSMVLVRGAPGTGKTSLALQFLIHGAVRHNESGLLISFEEFPSSLYRDAETLGWDLKELEKSGKLHLMFTSPEVFLASLEIPDSRLNQLLLEANIRRLVLDSVTHFTRLTEDAEELRRIYATVANGLRREGITAILVGEEGRAEYQRADRGGLSFIVDAIILLRYVEIESAMQRAVVVLKVRGSDHAKEIRRYEIEQGGITILDVFEGREGLLSGIPHRALAY
jgi:circadian clock protein KaiC